MHELSLVLHLLDVIADQARRADFDRVTSLRVEVGELACVETEAFLHCFEAASVGTVAEGARLRLGVLPARARCESCGLEFHLPALGTPCPDCGLSRLEVLAGRELRLRELEVSGPDC